VLNEIRFLKDLKVCNNIVQLDTVYSRHSKVESNVKYIMMVMKLAKDGSMLQHFSKGNIFSENEARVLMA